MLPEPPDVTIPTGVPVAEAEAWSMSSVIAMISPSKRVALGHSAFQGRYDRTVGCPHFEEALRLAEEAGEPTWEVRVLTWIALCHLEIKNLDDAIRTVERAHEVAQSTGWTFGISNAAAQSAWIALIEGDFDRARESATEAVELSRSLDDPYDLADAFIYLAQAARLSGGPRRGREVIDEALGMVSRRTDSVQLAKLHAEGAAAALALGEVDDAETAVRQALRLVVGTPQDPLLALFSWIVPIGAVVVGVGVMGYVFLRWRKTHDVESMGTVDDDDDMAFDDDYRSRLEDELRE